MKDGCISRRADDKHGTSGAPMDGLFSRGTFGFRDKLEYGLCLAQHEI